MARETDPNPDIQRTDGRKRFGRAAKARATPARGEAAAVAAAANRSDELAEATQQVRARTQARQAQQREPQREAMRGNVTAVGRNGEVLTRKRTGTSDPYAIPPEIVPTGWEYQWNAVTVVGNTEILMDQNLQMAENGWRPVPADRHPGRFMPVGHVGNITRGGLRLDERPKVLNEEAKLEDLRKARQLISDRNESLKLTSLKKEMRDGYEMGGKYGNRGARGDVRMSIDKGLDIPAPEHTLAGPGE